MNLLSNGLSILWLSRIGNAQETCPASCAQKPAKTKAPIYDGSQYPVPTFSCCDGFVECTGPGCTVKEATVNFGMLARGNVGIGGSTPPQYSSPVMAIRCGENSGPLQKVCPLKKLEVKNKDQLHLGPLFRSSVTSPESMLGTVFTQKSSDGIKKSDKILVLIFRDVDNLYHQVGSVIATVGYVLEAAKGVAHEDLEIAFLDNFHGKRTGPLWSPGIAAHSWNVRNGPHTPTTYSKVLLPTSSQRHWWWRVGQTRSMDLTDKRAFFQNAVNHMLTGLAATDVPDDGGVITMLLRPLGSKRGRGWKDSKNVKIAIEKAIPSMKVEAVEFSEKMSWKEQFRQIRRTRLLISTHGAGLSWGLLLPYESGVLEMLMAGQQEQAFYMGLSIWQGRPYRRHQPKVLMDAPRDWHGEFYEEPDTVASLVKDFLEQLG